MAAGEECSLIKELNKDYIIYCDTVYVPYRAERHDYYETVCPVRA